MYDPRSDTSEDEDPSTFTPRTAKEYQQYQRVKAHPLSYHLKKTEFRQYQHEQKQLNDANEERAMHNERYIKQSTKIAELEQKITDLEDSVDNRDEELNAMRAERLAAENVGNSLLSKLKTCDERVKMLTDALAAKMPDTSAYHEPEEEQESEEKNARPRSMNRPKSKKNEEDQELQIDLAEATSTSRHRIKNLVSNFDLTFTPSIGPNAPRKAYSHAMHKPASYNR